MYSSKNILGACLLKYFGAKKGIFSDFFGQNVCETACLSTVFVHFSQLGPYLPSLIPSTTNPCLDTPLANSQCTKQFLSCLYSL
jgi:hypothetical protein